MAFHQVYLAEDPYPVLHGPLLAPFAMVVQQDFGGPLGGRPACHRVTQPHHASSSLIEGGSAAAMPPGIGSCGAHRGTSLLNIGLVYARGSRAGEAAGGVLAVINGTSQRFLRQLGVARSDAAAAQPQHVESLIDQPLMRGTALPIEPRRGSRPRASPLAHPASPLRFSPASSQSPSPRATPPRSAAVVAELSVSEPGAGKSARGWAVVPGSAAPVYAGSGSSASGGAAGCALGDARACEAVAAERARSAFLAQLVRPPHRAGAAAGRTERIALAPDWLFGRGCLLHVREPRALLRATQTDFSSTQCTLPPPGPRRAMPAPGPAAGVLVATHFVYSMALKRKRSFKAFAWDAAADERNRTRYAAGGACWRRAKKGILFGHTFFAQTDAKAVLCAMPSGDEPECSCCATLKALEPAATSNGGAYGHKMETTGGSSMRWMGMRAAKLQQGCADYQMFWD